MRSQLEPKFEMSQRYLFIGLLVLSLNINEIYSQSEKESEVLIGSIGIKPMTQNVSYQTKFLPSFTNPQPTIAITTSVQVSISLSSSKPSVTFKSSLSSASSATGSILLSANIKDESISLLSTTSTPSKTVPLSSEFTLHSLSITQQALSPTHLSLPSIVYFTTNVITATSATSREAMMETTANIDVEPTPTHTISLSSKMTITGGQLISTSISRGIERSATVRESSVRVNGVQSTLGVTSTLSSTVVKITSATSSASVDSYPQITGTEAEETATTRARTPIATSGVTIPAAIGVVVAGTLVLVSLAFFILVLCYCFRRSRKYEYSTGNEYRVTVQKWNAQFTHYTVNQCESVSSSRGSSLLSIWSSNGMKPRSYGGISSAADHLHSVAHFEMYSTPL